MIKNSKLKKKPYNRSEKKRWVRYPLMVFALAVGLAMGSCGLLKHTPQKEETIITYKDSTIVHVKDSIRITEATRYKDWAGLLDTLQIDASHSHMKAWTDTTRNILAGELSEDPIQEKTHIVYKDRLVLKDTTIYKEIPYEVEKPVRYIPRWCWWSLVLNILGIVFLGIKVYFKFFK